MTQGWSWDRRGRLALAAMAVFQLALSVVGKLDALARSRRINAAIAEAEGGKKAAAFFSGIVDAASSGYWIVYVWLAGSALLLLPVVVYRPKRTRA